MAEFLKTFFFNAPYLYNRQNLKRNAYYLGFKTVKQLHACHRLSASQYYSWFISDHLFGITLKSSSYELFPQALLQIL